MFFASIDQTTPQQTIQGFQQAIIAGNYKRAFAYMTHEAQTAMIAGWYFSAAYLAQDDPVAGQVLAKLIDRYGISDKTKNKSRNSRELVKMFRALLRWSRTHHSAEDAIDPGAAMAQTAYSDFRIKADKAYVLCTDGKDRKSESRLVCVDGRWYLC